MKKVFLGFLVLAAIIMSGCSKDDNNDLNLTADFLKETSWSGTVTYKDSDGMDVQDNISILFTRETTGQAEVEFHDAEPGSLVDIGYFTYTVDGKRLNIKPVSIYEFLYGNWMVIEKTNKKLVLTKNLQSQQNAYTLRLERIY